MLLTPGIPSDEIDRLLHKAQKEAAIAREFFDKRVNAEPLKLRTAVPFVWPDGRRMRFTHLQTDSAGSACMVIPGKSERVRLDLLETEELWQIADLVPGEELPGDDQVIQFPGRL